MALTEAAPTTEQIPFPHNSAVAALIRTSIIREVPSDAMVPDFLRSPRESGDYASAHDQLDRQITNSTHRLVLATLDGKSATEPRQASVADVAQAAPLERVIPLSGSRRTSVVKMSAHLVLGTLTKEEMRQRVADDAMRGDQSAWSLSITVGPAANETPLARGYSSYRGALTIYGTAEELLIADGDRPAVALTDFEQNVAPEYKAHLADFMAAVQPS